GDGQLLLAIQSVPKRLAFHERHDVEEESVGGAAVEQRQYVGVLKVCGEFNLLQEPFGSEDRRELGVQNLYGNFAVVLDVFGEVDRSHATRAELTLDVVSAVERCPEWCCWGVEGGVGQGGDNLRGGVGRGGLGAGVGTEWGRSGDGL